MNLFKITLLTHVTVCRNHHKSSLGSKYNDRGEREHTDYIIINIILLFSEFLTQFLADAFPLGSEKQLVSSGHLDSSYYQKRFSFSLKVSFS